MIEYLAHGVPAVVTTLPVPAALVQGSGGGLVVPFGDVEAVVRAVLGLAADPQRARRMGAAGHAAVAAEFVAALEHAALQRPTPAGPG